MDKYPVGVRFMNAEKEVCHCGDGTPHYHAYEVMWNGKTWIRQGTQEWRDLSDRLANPSQT